MRQSLASWIILPWCAAFVELFWSLQSSHFWTCFSCSPLKAERSLPWHPGRGLPSGKSWESGFTMGYVWRLQYSAVWAELGDDYVFEHDDDGASLLSWIGKKMANLGKGSPALWMFWRWLPRPITQASTTWPLPETHLPFCLTLQTLGKECRLQVSLLLLMLPFLRNGKPCQPGLNSLPLRVISKERREEKWQLEALAQQASGVNRGPELTLSESSADRTQWFLPKLPFYLKAQSTKFTLLAPCPPSM